MKTKDVEKKLKAAGFKYDFTAVATIHLAGGRKKWATITENKITVYDRNPLEIAQEAWDKEKVKEL